VQIRCDNCQAAYDVDPPAGSAAALVEMMFRCTECGRTFPICFGEPEVAHSPQVQPAAEEETKGLLLKQDGKVYHVQDLAKLQRWIAERRVLADDEVSRGGGAWQAVGQIEELGIFFRLLDQIDQVSEDEVIAEVTGSTEQTEIGIKDEGLGVALPPVELTIPDDAPLEELALEGIPDESELEPPPTELLGPDDPTMDLGEEAGDFFSEEIPLQSMSDQSVFDASTEEYHPDDDPDFIWVSQRRRQTYVWWTVLFVLGTGGGLFLFDALNTADKAKTQNITVTPQAPDPEPPGPQGEPGQDEAKAKAKADTVVPEEVDTVVPEEVGTVVPEEVDTVVPEEVDTVVPEKEEKDQKEEKKEEKRKSARAEIAQGWKATDAGKWAVARTHFKAALKAKPGNQDARFGLAYVTEHTGNTARAKTMYCKIARGGGGDSKREAEGRLRKLRHTCP
jgi:hypothetical protein